MAAQIAGDPGVPITRNTGSRLAAARRPPWLLSGLVRCGVCDGPIAVTTSGGRLGCANRHDRGTCSNPRTVPHERLLPRVFAGLKERLLAPELVAQFVRDVTEEIVAANRERIAQQSRMAGEHAKHKRQLHSLLELMKDGHGTSAMVKELQAIEHRLERLDADRVSTNQVELIPTPHPNLPALYRRKVEALETALLDPTAEAAATAALRTLIDAIVVYPGEKRGEYSVQLRGDLAAFLYLAEAANYKNAAPFAASGVVYGSMGTLVAGTGFEPVTFRL